MHYAEDVLKNAAAWWQMENENSPSEENARMLAILDWLVDATPSERSEWFEITGGFEAEITKAVLNGIVDDAQGAAVEMPTESSTKR